jgi:hypothetical protein
MQFGLSTKCWIVVTVHAWFLAQFNKYITRFVFWNFSCSDRHDCEAIVRSGSASDTVVSNNQKGGIVLF